MTDNVNHPPHYKQHPSGVECIQITEHMNFNLGNAVKYIWRADHKGKQIEDLKKAVFYIQREIKRLEKELSDVQVGINGFMSDGNEPNEPNGALNLREGDRLIGQDYTLQSLSAGIPDYWHKKRDG